MLIDIIVATILQYIHYQIIELHTLNLLNVYVNSTSIKLEINE